MVVIRACVARRQPQRELTSFCPPDGLDGSGTNHICPTASNRAPAQLDDLFPDSQGQFMPPTRRRSHEVPNADYRVGVLCSNSNREHLIHRHSMPALTPGVAVRADDLAIGLATGCRRDCARWFHARFLYFGTRLRPDKSDTGFTSYGRSTAPCWPDPAAVIAGAARPYSLPGPGYFSAGFDTASAARRQRSLSASRRRRRDGASGVGPVPARAIASARAE